MFCLYILKSYKTNRYYIGSTNDISKRLEKHKKGYVRSTKAYKPWQLVYTEEYKTLTEARKRENQIKSWKSRESIDKLIKGPVRLAA